MKTAVLGILCILLFSSIAVAAVYDVSYSGYSGQPSRERRAYDPYSREQYFGEGYVRPYVNYGSKGPTYRATNTGAKSAFSSVYNLDTNAYAARGRDPSKISNWDPNVRGYPRLDTYVDLLPYSPVETTYEPSAVMSKGTARVVSAGNPYGAADLQKRWLRGQVFIQMKNLPPVAENEVYEAWLFDDETEYSLSIGLLKSGAEYTSSLYMEIARLLSPFDAVYITKEPFPDVDPSPGEIVIWGDIPQNRDETTVPTSYFDRLR